MFSNHYKYPSFNNQLALATLVQSGPVFMAEENEEFCNLAHLHYAQALLHSRQLSYLEPSTSTSLPLPLHSTVYSL